MPLASSVGVRRDREPEGTLTASRLFVDAPGIRGQLPTWSLSHGVLLTDLGGVPVWYEQMCAKLRSFADRWVQDGRHSVPPPGEDVRGLAQSVLDESRTVGLRPYRVVVSARSEIGVWFHDGTRFAEIECAEADPLILVMENGPDDEEPLIEELPPDRRGVIEALRRIAAFLQLDVSHSGG